MRIPARAASGSSIHGGVGQPVGLAIMLARRVAHLEPVQAGDQLARLVHHLLSASFLTLYCPRICLTSSSESLITRSALCPCLTAYSSTPSSAAYSAKLLVCTPEVFAQLGQGRPAASWISAP